MPPTTFPAESAGAPAGSYRQFGPHEAYSPGVSWPAVFAGSAVTAALFLILLALGTGLGLSSVSFWTASGASATAIGAASIIWIILMEMMSSAMGGYVAGRLRTKWTSIHNDEVYFRDTVHGLVAWSVALVVTAAFLASAAATMVGAPPVGDTSKADHGDYFVDALFRADGGKQANLEMRNEAGRIFAAGLAQRDISSDKGYLDTLVMAATGLSQADADQRVSDVFSRAQQAADKARKNIAHSLLWAFLALLIGAFSASFAATIGGRQRDHVVVI